MHGWFHCFTLHRRLLPLNIVFFSSFPSRVFFQNLNEILFFFFLYSCSIIHITLPVYLRTAPLFPHPLNILLLFGMFFFSFIQLLIYERTFSEFVHGSCLLYNLQYVIVFQWKWIFRALYSVFCIFVFWNIRYTLPFKEMWREETLRKILERCFFHLSSDSYNNV